jgi:hypothetical protein
MVDTSFVLLAATISRGKAEQLLQQQPRWLLIQHPDWPLALMHANDLAKNLLEDQREQINLLAIAAHRENTVEVSLQATLAETLQAMNDAQVNAAYLKDGQRIAGLITRGRIESYYTYQPVCWFVLLTTPFCLSRPSQPHRRNSAF